MPRAGRPPAPWWLPPHLLGLDAPLVALAWQDWWSRTEHAPLALSQRVLLGLGVWLIYLADRLADTARDTPGDCLTARHAFARTHRRSLLALAAVVAASLVVLAPCVLPVGEFGGGLLLLAAAGAYFWLIHRRRSQRWTARLPKEAAVGGMFALGTAFFALCRPGFPAWTFVAAVVLFGAACFANCALITSWERNRCDRHDPFSFLNAFPWLAAGGLRPACWLLAGVAALAGWTLHDPIFLPVVLGALALGALDRWRHRVAPDALRCLADAVLLAPWLCAALIPTLR